VYDGLLLLLQGTMLQVENQRRGALSVPCFAAKRRLKLAWRRGSVACSGRPSGATSSIDRLIDDASLCLVLSVLLPSFELLASAMLW